MSSTSDSESRVLEIVARCAARDPAGLDLGTPLFGGGLDLDSLTIVRIVTSVEEELGVALDEDDLDLAALESIGTLARFVARQRQR